MSTIKVCVLDVKDYNNWMAKTTWKLEAISKIRIMFSQQSDVSRSYYWIWKEK